MLRRLPFVAAIFLIIAAAGCSRSLDRSEVIGHYHVNHDKGVDILELHDDGTYYHYYKPNWSDKAYISESSWKFVEDNGDYNIVFYDFTGYIISEDFHRADSPGLVPSINHMPIRKTYLSGEIQITISADSGFLFIKG